MTQGGAAQPASQPDSMSGDLQIKNYIKDGLRNSIVGRRWKVTKLRHLEEEV